MVKVILALAPRLAVEQVTIPEAKTQLAEADMNIAPEGSVLLTTT